MHDESEASDIHENPLGEQHMALIGTGNSTVIPYYANVDNVINFPQVTPSKPN